MRKGCSGGQTEPSQSSTLISWENSSRQEHICYQKESRKKPMLIKCLLMAWVCDVCVVSFSLHCLASFLFCRYGRWPRVSHGDSLTYDRARGWTGPKNCSSTHLPYCIMLPSYGRDKAGWRDTDDLSVTRDCCLSTAFQSWFLLMLGCKSPPNSLQGCIFIILLVSNPPN